GTALKRISLNNTDWSIVFGADPRIRLPPEENGEIAEACAPTITQTNSSMGLNPVARAIPGTTGNSAGATTPSVLANRDINIPITTMMIGMSANGIVVETQSESWSITPASMAT